MALTLADVGAVQILTSYLKKTQPAGGNDLTVKLFVNNITPTDADIAATYTEAAGGGYAAKILTAANWVTSVFSNIAQAAYVPQLTWTFTGALTANATIYGYYVVDADGVLIFAEKALTPFIPANNGDTLIFNPVIQLSKGTPT